MRMWRWSAALLLGAAAVACAGRPSFQEQATVQKSLARAHDAELDSRNSRLTMWQR
ncbi:MAG TPA: hypothetical protein VMH22_01135 [bacterium]|nr:hypothetical protein [bacterium]